MRFARAFLFLLFALVAFSFSAGAQSVSLSWSPSTSSGTNTYNVYRTERLSGAADSFAKISSGQTGTTYSDSAVSYGHLYSYYVTTVNSGQESAPSNVILVYVQPINKVETSGPRARSKR